MSLRRESVGAYRQLYCAVALACREGGPVDKAGITDYVSRRFRNECERYRLELSRITEHSASGVKGKNAKRVHRLLADYQRRVSEQIDAVRQMSSAIACTSQDPKLQSILSVLGAGVGNTALQKYMERHYFMLAEHDRRKEDRDEASDDGVSERQNRILQQAILPYAERLLLSHRAFLPPSSFFSCDAALTALPRWKMTELMSGSRAGVSVHHLSLGHDSLVLEVDETYNKQSIYIVCHNASANPPDKHSPAERLSDSFPWDEEVERVDIAEIDEISRTIFSKAYLVKATQLCTALERETPLHRSRKTVVIGHSVGGAVGLILALLLLNRGFDINNVISFGAPKSMQGTLQRYVSSINPLRVVLAGDPLVDVPVTGAEGQPFIHVGEILLLSPQSSLSSDTTPIKEINSAEQDSMAWRKKQYRNQFSVAHYVHHLSDSAVPLSYAEGDDAWDEGDYRDMQRQRS